MRSEYFPKTVYTGNRSEYSLKQRNYWVKYTLFILKQQQQIIDRDILFIYLPRLDSRFPQKVK